MDELRRKPVSDIGIITRTIADTLLGQLWVFEPCSLGRAAQQPRQW
jgi:hypothetical protein